MTSIDKPLYGEGVGEGPESPAGLAARVTELTDQSRLLTQAVSDLKPRVERAERVSFRTAVVGLVLIFLVFILGWVAVNQQQTASRLDNLVQHSLCPVYALVVGGYDPSTRPAGASRDTYNHTFDVMRGAYADLGCTNTLVPPRTD